MADEGRTLKFTIAKCGIPRVKGVRNFFKKPSLAILLNKNER